MTTSSQVFQWLLKIAGGLPGSQTIFQSLGSQRAQHEDSFGSHFAVTSTQTLYQIVSDKHISHSVSPCSPDSLEEMSWCPICLPEWWYLNLRAAAVPKTMRRVKGKGIRSSQRHVGTLQRHSQGRVREGGTARKTGPNFKCVLYFRLSGVLLGYWGRKTVGLEFGLALNFWMPSPAEELIAYVILYVFYLWDIEWLWFHPERNVMICNTQLDFLLCCSKRKKKNHRFIDAFAGATSITKIYICTYLYCI